VVREVDTLIKKIRPAKFVGVRFPVATANPNVLAFGEIRRFRTLAEGA